VPESRNQESGLLEQLLARRDVVLEIIAVAAILAFGVNVLAAVFVHQFGNGWLTGGIAGASLGIVVVYLLSRVVKARETTRLLEARVFYDASENALVRVPHYRFSTRTAGYLDSLFAEEQQLGALWAKASLAEYVSLRPAPGTSPSIAAADAAERAGFSSDLICEAAEYFVLGVLSRHLTEYFADERFRRDRLTAFERKDVSHFFETNHFISLFSRKLEEREPFSATGFTESELGAGAVLYGKGGTLYEKFQLLLPEKAELERVEVETGPAIRRVTCIKTKRFDLSLSVGFDGVHDAVEDDLRDLYVRYEDRPLRAFRVQVSVTARFKFGALALPAGLAYYRWVDSYIQQLERELSYSDFLDQIGWETARTVLRATRPTIVASPRARAPKPKPTAEIK
jgi:hypothetical protein